MISSLFSVLLHSYTFNMVTHTIIWVDTNASDVSSTFRSKLGDAQFFTESNDCIDYIQSHSNISIYLIVSGHLAKSLIPKVYEYSNLIKTFIFCGSIIAYAEWAMDYCDKLMIFDHGDDLLERLWNDLESQFRAQAIQYLRCADKYKNRALQYKQPACG
ncbi:hypothetical protein I4U23_001223 [Adineta vaga]|nr:hypothetical protein I4U23_001223 [Adineta vaga]